MCLIAYIELGCAADELGELRSVEFELKKEGNIQVVESRGIDPGHNVFQIFADSCERKTGERGEESTCRWRKKASKVWARSRRFEIKPKEFEFCQRGEAIGHR